MNSRKHFEFSAGGVVLSKNRVLLIRTSKSRDKKLWTLPKGKIEKKEDSRHAAIREVREETGYRCSIKRELGETRYLFKRDSSLVNKKVKWFLMEAVKKEGSPDRSVEETSWMDYEEALQALSYKSDIYLIKKVFS
ncbi:MAG: NUDIX hydrolase [Elusimicrobiota bacterium]